MEFTDCNVKRMDKHIGYKNLTAFDKEKLGCQSGDDDTEINFGQDTQNFMYKPYFII